jgi:hypothetical protein
MEGCLPDIREDVRSHDIRMFHTSDVAATELSRAFGEMRVEEKPILNARQQLRRETRCPATHPWPGRRTLASTPACANPALRPGLALPPFDGIVTNLLLPLHANVARAWCTERIETGESVRQHNMNPKTNRGPAEECRKGFRHGLRAVTRAGVARVTVARAGRLLSRHDFPLNGRAGSRPSRKALPGGTLTSRRLRPKSEDVWRKPE